MNEEKERQDGGGGSVDVSTQNGGEGNKSNKQVYLKLNQISEAVSYTHLTLPTIQQV